MIRLFAAESLSFLLRKQAPDRLPQTLDQIFSIIDSPIRNVLTPRRRRSTRQSSCSERQVGSDSNNNDFSDNNDDDDQNDSPIEIISKRKHQVLNSSDNDSSDSDVEIAEEDIDSDITINRSESENRVKKKRKFSKLENDEKSRLAESIGSLLFDVAKNVQNSFTGKLPIILCSCFTHMIKVASSVSTSPFIDITVRVFMQCLRKHVIGFDSRHCRIVEDAVIQQFQSQCDKICQFVKEFEPHDITENTEMKSSDPDLTLNPLLCIIRLVQEWTSVRPRPRGKPTVAIRETTKVLSQLLSSLSMKLQTSENSLKSDHFVHRMFITLWGAIIQTLIKLFLADPEVMTMEAFIGTSSLLPLLLRVIVQISPNALEKQQDATIRDRAAIAATIQQRTLHLIRILCEEKYSNYFNSEILQFVVECLLIVLSFPVKFFDSKMNRSRGEEIQSSALTFLASVIYRCGQKAFVIGINSQWKCALEQQFTLIIDQVENKEIHQISFLTSSISQLFNIVHLFKVIIVAENKFPMQLTPWLFESFNLPSLSLR